MTKRIEKQLNKFVNNGENARLTFGTIVLMLFCIMLIIVSTFTQFDFYHPIIPIDLFSNWDKYFTEYGTNWQGFLKHYKYIPQIPIIFFMLSLIDKKYASITVGLYLLLGLIGYPIFALGGGWRYVLEYGFYYIVGYIPAILFAGYITRESRSFLNILKCIFVGVLVIHIIGSLGMVFVALIKHESSTAIYGWLITMSGLKMAYDMFFSLIAYYIGYGVKRLLWIIMS